MTSEGRVCLGLADVKRYGVPKLNLPMAAIREGRIISRPRSRLCYSVASVCPFVCTECIVAKRCVVEQKLLLTTYRKSYMRNRLVSKWMTLTFVSRSYQCYVNHCVTFDVEYLGNR